jgi:hypothetical protein
MQAFKIPGSALIFASMMAATKGDADAELDFVVAKMRSGELYGIIIPSKKTLRM